MRIMLDLKGILIFKVKGKVEKSAKTTESQRGKKQHREVIVLQTQESFSKEGMGIFVKFLSSLFSAR